MHMPGNCYMNDNLVLLLLKNNLSQVKVKQPCLLGSLLPKNHNRLPTKA